MKYRYKLKVTEVDGEPKYMPMFKRFLFWWPLSIDKNFKGEPIYVEDTYEKAKTIIEAHKSMTYKPKRKRLRSADIPIE